MKTVKTGLTQRNPGIKYRPYEFVLVVNTAVGDLLAELNDTSDAASFIPLSQKEFYAAMTAMGESIDLEVMIYEWAKVTEPFTG
ncbi:MAG: hypothetical protein DMG86_22280 [Acidobacteria bacterium]|nr:MAG: hypothetical protein DMG86_22280 [Acidobacteriota bacterium]PYX12422.1 MAG: hypothetical protein DMG84_21730 [Acidobacteriota bacterium]